MKCEKKLVLRSRNEENETLSKTIFTIILIENLQLGRVKSSGVRLCPGQIVLDAIELIDRLIYEYALTMARASIFFIKALK